MFRAFIHGATAGQFKGKKLLKPSHLTRPFSSLTTHLVGMKTVRIPALILCAASLAFSGLVSPASANHTAASGNEYLLPALPEYITGPFPIEVSVSGPAPVCEVRYGNQKRSTAPWLFTLTPAAVNNNDSFDVKLCDGEFERGPWVDTEAPFNTGERFVDGNGAAVRNNLATPATVVLLKPDGAESFRSEIPPFGGIEIPLPEVKKTTTFSIVISNSSGQIMTAPVVKAVGWNVYDARLTKYDPCTTVTWAYDPSGKAIEPVYPYTRPGEDVKKKKQPAAAKTFKKDIQGSFDLLEKNTSLTFVETDDYTNADIRIGWANLGKGSSLGNHGTLIKGGTGSTDGQVLINTKGKWGTDRYEGFKKYGPKNYVGWVYIEPPGTTAGRGWLITHEIMHTLGFLHADSDNSIMAPIDYGTSKFSQEDLDGLAAVFGKKCLQ